MGNACSTPDAKTVSETMEEPQPSPSGLPAWALQSSARPLSLPKTVAAMGTTEWNKQDTLKDVLKTLALSCQASTVEDAVAEVKGFMSLGHNVWAYAYLRALCEKDMDLYYGMLLAEPALLLPVAYTPTVGEACQKFGSMPIYQRGCYVSISDRGNLKAVLQEYAEQMLPPKENQPGQYDCQCIVFSDGGRILGLGDLGVFGMGIPLGKLDLYTVCGGFDPRKTIPVMIDAGCSVPAYRDHALYTGLKQAREKSTHPSFGTEVNTSYYGDKSFIGEFMSAATDLFGTGCLLQFEDFNSNDAFPLLEEYRTKFLTYNDDIQGTASVAVAATLGGIKIQNPSCKSLVEEARQLRFLFHGAGSANLGSAMLLIKEGGVPQSNVFITNSSGLIWKNGSEGSFKNAEQKSVAYDGKPECGKDLVSIINFAKPNVLIGAVGRDPGCFTQDVITAMLQVQPEGRRPIVFALSNPKTQAEITAEQCYKFSDGKAIFGSGTRFEECNVNGKSREPGQVNNFFIFPGMSFGAMVCEASMIPENFFMVAAEAVANCLDAHDIDVESVVPHPGRIREVAEAVAVAVVMEAQAKGIAKKSLGSTQEEVTKALKDLMWNPKDMHKKTPVGFKRSESDFGNCAHHDD